MVGLLVVVVVLATILQRFHFEQVSGPSLDLRMSITARPKKPVEMTVHEREEWREKREGTPQAVESSAE